MSININHITNTLFSDSATNLITVDINSGLKLPTGTTAQRPSLSGNNGTIRYNSSNNEIEAIVNGAWQTLGSAGGTVPTSRLISTTSPLAGGGDLSADRTLSININGISNSLFRQSVGLSVVGRTSNTTGDVADISAGSDGHVLRRSGTTLDFGTLGANSLTDLAAFKPGGNTFTAAQNLGTISNHDLVFISNNIDRGRLLAGGNWSIGTSSNLARLAVTGAGNTSSTWSFRVQNSDNNFSLSIRDDLGILAGRVPTTGFSSGSGNLNLCGEDPDSVARLRILYASGTTASGPIIEGVHFRGTFGGGITASQANDDLLFLQGRGYDGTTISGGRVGIALEASENYTSSAQGTQIRFLTTNNGTTTLRETFRLKPDSGFTSFAGGTVGPTGTQAFIRRDGAATENVLDISNGGTPAIDSGVNFRFLGGTTGLVPMAVISSRFDAAADTNAYLQFQTRSSGTTAERMRLTSAGNLLIQNGTTALPSLSFISETGTGIARPAAGTLTFSGTGTELLRLDSTSLRSRPAATVTSAGVDLVVEASAGGSTSGNGGNITVRGGSATDGNGGSVNITGRDGTGTNRNGGNINITTGQNTGTGTYGRIVCSGAAYNAPFALTDAATITIDLARANNFSVTLAGNRTLGAPTNVQAGQSGTIVITQDSGGGRTLAYNSIWKFENGTIPILTTAGNAVDVLVYYVESSTRISARLLQDVK